VVHFSRIFTVNSSSSGVVAAPEVKISDNEAWDTEV
jgi:hypothetical protein